MPGPRKYPSLSDCFSLSRVAVALLVIAATGCTGASPPDSALDDEAMARYRREERERKVGPRRTEEEAAREWFYPRYVGNYFHGMDGVVQKPAVYQLLRDERDVPREPRVEDPLTRTRPCYGAERELEPACREILGRNTWMIWSGGNEAFWDWLGNQYGFLDLLKLLDSSRRSQRFAESGLINEPGMVGAEGPLDDEFGLLLDQPADPKIRAWRKSYLRATFGGAEQMSPPPAAGGLYSSPIAASSSTYDRNYAYQNDIPPPEIYGLSSGVVGLRLFPNPLFDAKARAKWDPKKYYDDPKGDPEMIRPFRVGMSCAFCHASYHPLKPPRDLINPAWENISGNIGAQYLRARAVFGNTLPRSNFIYHILDSQPPGTIDTSLIASDNINNPNTMNAVFNLPQRALVSFRNPRERQAAPSAELPSLWRSPEGKVAPDAPDVPPAAWRDVFEQEGLTGELQGSNRDDRRVPRVLLDGADSIGAWGALARVYLNIGTNHQQWGTLHNPVVGLSPQKPFTIANVKRHSIYWHATELRVPALRDYFLKVTPPMPLLAADGGVARAYQGSHPSQAMTDVQRQRGIDLDQLALGRKVFARNCIVCHSSIQPPFRFEDLSTTAGAGRGGGRELWDHDPGRWLSNPAYVKWAEAEVEKPDFWAKNYLSTDYRIPVNVVQTNACRALATNAITGNMWEDFSSVDYRNLPSIGVIPFFNPYLGASGGDDRFFPQHAVRGGAPRGGGGPGFYRVPSLVSIWATAPLLHNNSLGLFNNDPTVEGRLRAFDDAIRKLLWPERRRNGSSYNDATPDRLVRDHGLIWRTTEDTYLTIGAAYLPRILGAQAPAIAQLKQWFPRLTSLPKKYLPVPSALLLALGLVVLLIASHGSVRALGYGAVVAALVVGFLVYFLTGALLDVRIGPIPKGTPVNLIANVNPDASPEELRRVFGVVKDTLTEIESTQAGPGDVERLMRQRIAPALQSVSKCPDLVMDHGHYFEWFKSMSDQDKLALIELLKTF